MDWRTIVNFVTPPVVRAVVAGGRSGWPTRAGRGALPSIPAEKLVTGTSAAEVLFPASQIDRTRDMVLPLADLLTVAALCQAFAPRRVFEIGTYRGSTTLVMAMNTPPDADLFTLDLPLEEFGVPRGVTAKPGDQYQGTRYASKITQLAGRAETFDFTPWYGKIDLAFVDAVHTYEAVRGDTMTALRMLRPGGLLIWDDYVWSPEFPECAGVARWVDEFHRTTAPAVHLAGTRLAAHVRPAGPAG